MVHKVASHILPTAIRRLEDITSLKVIESFGASLLDEDLIVLESTNYDEIEEMLSVRYSACLAYSMRRALQFERTYGPLIGLYPFEIIDLDDGVGSLLLELLATTSSIESQIVYLEIYREIFTRLTSLTTTDRFKTDEIFRLQIVITGAIFIANTILLAETNKWYKTPKMRLIVNGKLKQLTDYNAQYLQTDRSYQQLKTLTDF